MIGTDNGIFSPSSRFWWLWCLVGVVVCAVHLTTLTISPTYWQDEVQIVDLGRVTLNPTSSDWSITWSDDDRPRNYLTYVGPVLQEMAYRIAGSSSAGPRISSILGALVAATVALGWLLSRGVPQAASWLLCLAFFLDPLLVQGYRGARVDVWAMAFCLTSCWVLRHVLSQSDKRLPSKWFVMLAGGLAAAAVFLWPTSIVLYPLIMVELAYLVRKIKEAASWKSTVSYLLAFAAGGLVLTVLLIIPVIHQAVWMFDSMQKEVVQRVTSYSLIDSVRATIIVFRTTPILPLVALVGALYRREGWLIVAIAVAVIIVLNSFSYDHRVVYLLPYFLVLSAGFYQHLEERGSGKTYRRVGTMLLIGLLAWSVGLTLVLRPMLAWSQKAERNPKILLEAAEASIGAGTYHVLVDPWEFYYAGRTLGWKIYRPDPDGEFSEVDRQKLLEHMDYALFRYIDYVPYIERLDSVMSQAGLYHRDTLMTSQEYPEEDGEILSFLGRFRGAKPYGPYLLYRR